MPLMSAMAWNRHLLLTKTPRQTDPQLEFERMHTDSQKSCCEYGRSLCDASNLAMRSEPWVHDAFCNFHNRRFRCIVRRVPGLPRSSAAFALSTTDFTNDFATAELDSVGRCLATRVNQKHRIYRDKPGRGVAASTSISSAETSLNRGKPVSRRPARNVRRTPCWGWYL